MREVFDIGEMDAESYLALAESAMAHGRPIPPPETAEQLRRLAEEHPERAKSFMPSRLECVRLGISGNLTREIAPFAVEWRERFLHTLQSDADFTEAIGRMIGGAA